MGYVPTAASSPQKYLTLLPCTIFDISVLETAEELYDYGEDDEERAACQFLTLYQHLTFDNCTIIAKACWRVALVERPLYYSYSIF